MSETSDIQKSLHVRYLKFQEEAEVPSSLASRLSSPLLIAATDAWSASKFRILIVGQEVLGWAFASGSYYEWPFNPVANFHDFKTNHDAVESLVQGYRVFDYAKYQPENSGGPFWSTYRKLRAGLEENIEGSILFTNLFRMSIDGGSVLKASRDDSVTVQKAPTH